MDTPTICQFASTIKHTGVLQWHNVMECFKLIDILALGPGEIYGKPQLITAYITGQNLMFHWFTLRHISCFSWIIWDSIRITLIWVGQAIPLLCYLLPDSMFPVVKYNYQTWYVILIPLIPRDKEDNVIVIFSQYHYLYWPHISESDIIFPCWFNCTWHSIIVGDIPIIF